MKLGIVQRRLRILRNVQKRVIHVLKFFFLPIQTYCFFAVLVAVAVVVA